MSDPQLSISAVRNAYRLVYLYQAILLQLLRTIESNRDLGVHLWHWNGPGTQGLPKKGKLLDEPAAYLPLIYSDFTFINRERADEPLHKNDIALYVVHTADSALVTDDDEIIDLLEYPSKATPTHKGSSTLSANIIVNKNHGKSSWANLYNAYSPRECTPFSGGDFGSNDAYKEHGWCNAGNGVYHYQKEESKLAGHTVDARMKRIDMVSLTDNDSIEQFVNELARIKGDLLKLG